MRARESALHDHGLGPVVERLRMEQEIGEPLLVRLEECIHTGLAVPDFPGGDYLVTRMRECGDAAVEVVRVLRLHVLPDRCFAVLTHLGAVKHRFSMPRSQVLILMASASANDPVTPAEGLRYLRLRCRTLQFHMGL